MSPHYRFLVAALAALLLAVASAAACSDSDAEPGGATAGDLGAGLDASSHDAALDDATPSTDSGGGSKTATGGSGGAKGVVNASCSGRSYTLHVPQAYSQAKPSALVVAMHGLGDSYQNFFATCKYAGWTGAADANGFIFMVPNHNNATRQSFLHLKGTAFDAAATKVEVDDLLQCIYKHVGAKYNIETTEIYWIGFSEGATFAVYAAYVLHKELRAVAPYAGAITALPLPFARKIPAYFICGAQDYSFSQISGAYQKWIGAGHPGKSSWVSGVGHKFSQLNQTGPSPGSVYQWMSTVACEPVQSGYTGS